MIKRKDKHMVVSGIAAAVGVSAATAAAGISAGASLIGTGAQLFGQLGAMGAQSDAMAAAGQAQAASHQAELIRRRQMLAEARFARLKSERERRIDMGKQVAAATATGGGLGSSSAGGAGGVYATYATETRQTGTARTHGLAMFEANKAYSIATGKMAAAQGEADQAVGMGKLVAGAASGFGSLANAGASLFGNAPGSWTTTVKPA
jgi:hypothetical protein